MSFDPLPPSAAWRHREAREGFEVVFFRGGPGPGLEGHVAAVEDGRGWAVEYSIAVDATWVTREARVTVRSSEGQWERRLESDGAGAWLIDGVGAPRLDGCLDVDLEASVLTNALPVHRLKIGQQSDAPAAFVRVADLCVERLEQRYRRIEDERGRERYAYAAPRFGYTGELVYDARGLLLDYPGLAGRAA